MHATGVTGTGVGAVGATGSGVGATGATGTGVGVVAHEEGIPRRAMI